MCKYIGYIFGNQFSPNNCATYPSLASSGIDCNCPFNLASGIIDLNGIAFDIPDLTTSPIYYLTNGDFNVTANISDNVENIANIQFKFSLKPAPLG
jgi:hypothetical protein